MLAKENESIVGNIAAQSFFDAVENKLAAERIVHMTGGVNPIMSHEMSVRLRYLASLSNKPITMYMNTPGGSILDGFAIYDLINEVKEKAPVNIIASGSCMSMGVIILQAATRRKAMPHAYFLLHELQGGADGSLSQMSDSHKFMVQLQKRLNDLLTERTGTDVKRLLKRRDFYIDAKEAKRLKLIDEIVEV